MTTDLIVLAGASALAHIRREGLAAADVSLIPAAAGGPKGLILTGLDQFIFGEWLPRANASTPRVRHLVGASIGAWRMACACTADPAAAIARLAHEYASQRYPVKPSPRYVADYCRDLIARFLMNEDHHILTHPHHRLTVLAVRGRGPLARERRGVTPGGFALAALANAAHRRALGAFMERVAFHDVREKPPAMPTHDFRVHGVALSDANLREALLASAGIPLVIAATHDIAGAPRGAYWDGGIIDYHLHWPYPRAGGIVLYPHLTDHIVPGWLDKSLPWRRARGAWLDNVVLLAPSRTFIDRLPNRKLPDRNDFKRYGFDGQDARIRDWLTAVAESRRLADAFSEMIQRGDIAAHVQALT